MKTQKLFTFIFMLFLLIYNHACTQPIEFKIDIFKSSYIEGEPIYIMFELKNISYSDINIEKPYIKIGAIDINLKDSKGKSYYNRSGTIPTSGKFTLSAGMTKLEFLELTGFFAPQKEWPNIAYLPENIYTVQAIYYADYERKNKYVSNELTFTVKKPEGENLLAFEEFKKGHYEYWGGSYENAMKIYEDIYKKYPNTPSASFALNKLFSFYQIHKQDTLKTKIYAELLLNYPNTFGARNGMFYLMNNLPDTDKQVFLDSLKNKYKNTLLEKFIDYFKKGVEQ